MTPPEHADRFGRGVSTAKAILLGEHFVVHGSPALAVPLLGLRLAAEVRPARAGEENAGGHLEACERIVFAALGLDAERHRTDVESRIPVGSGLGSSAALSVALARAAAAAQGLEPDPGRDRELSMRCERLAHGRPSGIDTEVCLTGRPIWTEGGRFTPLGGEAGRGVGLVVLHAGPGGATGEMIARVNTFRTAHGARFQRLAERTRERCLEARALLEGTMGDEGREPLAAEALARLGAILSEQHEALTEIGVSTPALDAAARAACDAGAVGAKLSGAGGGGAVVALAPLGAVGDLAARLAAKGETVVTSGPLL